jgi:hypothetical protein
MNRIYSSADKEIEDLKILLSESEVTIPILPLTKIFSILSELGFNIPETPEVDYSVNEYSPFIQIFSETQQKLIQFNLLNGTLTITTTQI